VLGRNKQINKVFKNMHNNCKCPHHMANKVLMLLVWVSGVLFFWSSWGIRTFWGFDALYWAWSVVVLSLMAFSSKLCGCCGMGMGHKMMGDKMEGGKMMCSHEGDCKCGDCDRCK